MTPVPVTEKRRRRKLRCAVCRKRFEARRDARTCSPKCRQRAYRARRRVWSGDEAGNVFVDGRPVGTVRPGAAWETTGVEWFERPPFPGFRPSGGIGEDRPAPSSSAPRARRRPGPPAAALPEGRVKVILDGQAVFEQLGRIRGGLVSMAERYAEAASWEERNAWLLKVAMAAEGLAAEARDMAGGRPIAFYGRGHMDGFLRDDGVSPTLTKSDGAPVVWFPPRDD